MAPGSPGTSASSPFASSGSLWSTTRARLPSLHSLGAWGTTMEIQTRSDSWSATALSIGWWRAPAIADETHTPSMHLEPRSCWPSAARTPPTSDVIVFHHWPFVLASSFQSMATTHVLSLRLRNNVITAAAEASPGSLWR